LWTVNPIHFNLVLKGRIIRVAFDKTAQMLARRADYPELFNMAFGRRPEEELYDVKTDAGCLQNLASLEAHTAERKRLRALLEGVLREEGDPRRVGPNTDIFDSYPRVSEMRPQLGGFVERNTYNPAFQD